MYKGKKLKKIGWGDLKNPKDGLYSYHCDKRV